MFCSDLWGSHIKHSYTAFYFDSDCVLTVSQTADSHRVVKPLVVLVSHEFITSPEHLNTKASQWTHEYHLKHLRYLKKIWDSAYVTWNTLRLPLWSRSYLQFLMQMWGKLNWLFSRVKCWYCICANNTREIKATNVLSCCASLKQKHLNPNWGWICKKKQKNNPI